MLDRTGQTYKSKQHHRTNAYQHHPQLLCFCPDIAAQRKQEIMYRLRECIRNEEVDVDHGLRSVKLLIGDGMESLMDEALQSKCPDDGQNLLMSAAAEGREAWFLRLADEIRSRVSYNK